MAIAAVGLSMVAMSSAAKAASAIAWALAAFDVPDVLEAKAEAEVLFDVDGVPKIWV